MHRTLPPPGSVMILLHCTLHKYTNVITLECILAKYLIHLRSSHPFLTSYPLEPFSRSVRLPHISLNILEITPYPVRSGSKQPCSNLYKEGWFVMEERREFILKCCQNYSWALCESIHNWERVPHLVCGHFGVGRQSLWRACGDY